MNLLEIGERMFAILVTILMILLLALIMEIAATALKITGMDIHEARFQALSALTGTGFTTQETENIMDHRQRRRIIMALMVLGPFGLLTILGSMLISTRTHVFRLQLILLILPLAIMLIFIRSSRFRYFLHQQIEKQLKKRGYPKRVMLEESLQLDKNYGVSELKVDQNSGFLNKRLQETNFKDLGLVVLAIKREGVVIAAPKGDDLIENEDSLVIFGNLANVKSLLEPAKKSNSTQPV